MKLAAIILAAMAAGTTLGLATVFTALYFGLYKPSGT